MHHRTYPGYLDQDDIVDVCVYGTMTVQTIHRNEKAILL